MFCENCGSKLPDDAVFCPDCGYDLRPKDGNGKAEGQGQSALNGSQSQMGPQSAGMPNGGQPDMGPQVTGMPNGGRPQMGPKELDMQFGQPNMGPGFGPQSGMGQPYYSQPDNFVSYTPPTPVKQPAGGMAVIALILSILGLLMSCAFGIGGIFAIIALILAIVAGKKGNTSGTKKGAIVVSIISIVFAVLTVLAQLFIFGLTGATSKYGSRVRLETDIQLMHSMQTCMQTAYYEPEVAYSPEIDEIRAELEDGINLSEISPDDNILYRDFFSMLNCNDSQELLDGTKTPGVDDWYFELQGDDINVKAVGDNLKENDAEALSTF
ncbi:MAG: zinc-ribbon domain-containing protein [Lachnospiraceae bacterium]|nr:zinc-ribbon domain-containing protein [Lachnospiraceae bacterium]